MKEYENTNNLDVWAFVYLLAKDIHSILGENLTGLYVHGSLVLGGFSTASSDIDLIGITEAPLAKEDAFKLKTLLLAYSMHPYPVEISFLNTGHLIGWEHPSAFDFHFSEQWRNHFELAMPTSDDFTFQNIKDEDLAAHLTVVNHKGICILGKPISNVFPSIPKNHYLSSILGDFQSCLQNIEQEPVYCTLNIIRVYQYLRNHEITSKLEAGEWGQNHLPREYKETIQRIMNRYQTNTANDDIKISELIRIREHIVEQVEKLLGRPVDF